MHLTGPTIRALSLPPGRNDRIFFDEGLPGFGVRVRASGSKTFVVQYDVNGRTRRIPLGSVTVIDLSKARSSARDLLAKVRLGQDPAQEKAEARVRASDTFAAILPAYLAHKRGAMRPNSFKKIVHHLQDHARPLHARALTSITRRDVATLITAVTHGSGPTAARNFRAAMFTFFSWTISQGLLEVHPVAYTAKPTEAGSRDRVLSNAELRAVWLGAGTDTDFGNVVKLLILTGQRRTEIGGLRWSEIDLDQAMIHIPPARSKNKRAHDVPLSPPALEILENMRAKATRDFVFGRVGNGLRNWDACKKRLDRRIAEAGSSVEPWRLHDLRRSAATKLAELNIQPHVIEALLNHQSGTKRGVAGTYNRATYFPERTEALLRWADFVMSLVEGRPVKVVSLRA